MTLRLPTSTKIQIARLLHAVVSAGRRWGGLPGERALCRRNGIRWELDLAEGIDLALFLFGRFERMTSLSLERALGPGMVALDVGANVGAHALPMARSVLPSGRVYAVEPTDFAFERLLRNRALNPSLGAALIPIRALLGAGESSQPQNRPGLYASWRVAGDDASRHPIHRGTLHSTLGAETLTLDALADRFGWPRLDVIKLDVDGDEEQVLEGGRATIGAYRPHILLELCPYLLVEHGSSLGALVYLLGSFDYRLLSESRRRPLPLDVRSLESRIPRGGSINAWAVPA